MCEGGPPPAIIVSDRSLASKKSHSVPPGSGACNVPSYEPAMTGELLNRLCGAPRIGHNARTGQGDMAE